MKTKDLVYIGIIGYLAYLLLRKKPETKFSNGSNVPAGNASNGGLNLGTNMDLPNLTPTAPDGLPTEVALNSSNVSPLIKDNNEPTQIFGSINLPPNNIGTSIVNPNPVDVISVADSQVSTNPSTPIITQPVSVPAEIAQPISSMPSEGISSPSLGTSIIAEPIYPIKSIEAELITEQPILGEPIKLSDDIKDEIILECGSSFSIPNNDKEGSYTNYWIDGDTFYTQTSSPLIKTIATKISKEAYLEGCKKLQLIKMQNGKY